MQSLLFHFLDEFLFLFSADPFFIPRVSGHLLKLLHHYILTQFIKITEFDQNNFTIKAEGHGETFDLSKHPQGTEVKAITYSNMQIYNTTDKHECYVIIDI